MLEKFLFLILLSSIYTNELPVKYLEKYGNITVDLTDSEEKNFCVCVEIDEELQKDDDFFLLFSCDEKDTKMKKSIYYNFTEISCNQSTPIDIDLNNLDKEFNMKIDTPNLESNDLGFVNEYKITKKENNQKYVLLLVKDFNGDITDILYSSFSAKNVVIFVIVIVLSIIVLIIIVIVLIKIFCRRKSFVQDTNLEDPLTTRTYSTSNVPN